MENKDIAKERSDWREMYGWILLVVFLLFTLSLFTYEPRDISILKVRPNMPSVNIIGPLGAWTGFVLFMAFGLGAYLVMLFTGILGLMCLIQPNLPVKTKAIWMLVLLLAMVMLMELQPQAFDQQRVLLNLPTNGGLTGHFLGQRLLVRLVGPVGATIMLSLTIAISLVFLFKFSPIGFLNWLKLMTLQTSRKVNQFLENRLDEQPFRRFFPNLF